MAPCRPDESGPRLGLDGRRARARRRMGHHPSGGVAAVSRRRADGRVPFRSAAMARSATPGGAPGRGASRDATARDESREDLSRLRRWASGRVSLARSKHGTSGDRDREAGARRQGATGGLQLLDAGRVGSGSPGMDPYRRCSHDERTTPRLARGRGEAGAEIDRRAIPGRVVR